MARPVVLLTLFFTCYVVASTHAYGCIGQYQLCQNNACAWYGPDCEGAALSCDAGQYLCPDRKTCVNSAEDYVDCPGLKGTHLDWTLSLQERLDYLANHTTLTQQIWQLQNQAPALPDLGIPEYNFLNDDEHGVRLAHATSFPNGCSLGPTWNKTLLHEVGTAIGVEARAGHNGYVHEGQRGMPTSMNGVGITLYSPNLNQVRDPRWGRAQEVWSEDPYLTSRFVIEFVTGIQKGESGYYKAVACCKHFAVYDVEDLPVTRFVQNAIVNSRTMWETYMVAFEACIVEAKGQSVMCSYNSVNGVPTCGNGPMLNGILREQWGFEGFVVSDYDAWANIYATHHYCPNYECAAAVGIKAGLDQEGGRGAGGGGINAISHLGAAVASGNVTTDDVATAFKRLFRARITLGMLDPPAMSPYKNWNNGTDYVLSPAHIELARDAARQGMCLYKNKNNVLPLDVNTVGKVAVVGPNANGTGLLLGNYAVTPTVGVTSVLEGIAGHMLEALNPAAGYNCTLYPGVDYYQPGQAGVNSASPEDCCKRCTLDPECAYFTFWNGLCFKKTSEAGTRKSAGRTAGACHTPKPAVSYAAGCSDIYCSDPSDYEAAVAAAAAADVTIVVLGLNQELEAETHDRESIDLPAGQYALVDELRAATDKPIIAVLVHGGTLGLTNITNQLDAIVDAWYPGMEGGNAVADVLFGDYNPAGRASVTYYKYNSQLPPHGLMNPYAGNGSNGLTYRFFDKEPLYPFGYGLSYTNFSYSGMATNASSYEACDVIGVTVSVTNTGDVDGDEVVQLYAKQPEASMPCPNVRLVDFERVHVKAGETVKVQLAVLPSFHIVVPLTEDVYNGVQTVEVGPLDLFVGGGQPDFYAGHLSTTVAITTTANAREC